MKITFDKKNYRKHSEQNKKRIRKSLTECGAGRSVLVDKDGCLIAGNGVFEQAEKMGIKTRVVETDGTELVVVKRTDIGTDDPKRKTLALADNATSDNVEWDMENIAADFDVSVADDWGISVDMTVEQEPQEAKEDDFDEEKDPVATICQEGDVWQLGEHRLMCGDSTKAEDVARLMDGDLASMVFTDPPYGVSYTEKNEYLNSLGTGQRLTKAIENDSKSPEEMYEFWVKAFTMLHKHSEERMSYYVTAPQGGDLLLLLLLQALRDSGFMLKHQLVWNKNNHVLGRCDYNYKHEPIIYGWKIKGTHNFYGKSKFKTSVWDIPKPLKNDLHPTMKPLELIEGCLLDATLEGDKVLDLFGGSGTTLIASEQLGRKCYMMELDPHYCDVIIARWEKLTGQKAIKL